MALKKKIVIIDSGFSGLAAACCLAQAGADVTVLEKNEQAGGRARSFEADGFLFDMGPCWYWMPDVFENFFQLFGKNVADYYALKLLSPSFSVFFSRDEKINIPESEIESDFTLALNRIRSLPKGAGLGVYVAFVYYKVLFAKIKSVPAEKVMRERIRVPNNQKFRLLINSVIRHQFYML